jgi:hypothetical protein
MLIEEYFQKKNPCKLLDCELRVSKVLKEII